MADLFKLVKFLLKNKFKKDARRKRGTMATLIVVLVAFLPLLVFTCVAMAFLAAMAVRDGTIREFMALLSVIPILPTLIMGIISMLNVLIFARDNEFLCTLPVSRTKVFLAKFFMVYFDELITSAVLYLPFGITVGIVAGGTVAYYAFLLVVAMIMPLLALVVSAILVLPTMYVVAFFRKRATLSAVFCVLLFGAIMAFVYSGVSMIPPDENLDFTGATLSKAVAVVMAFVWKNFLPARLASGLLTGNLLDGLLLLLIAAVAVGIATAICVPLHKRAITLQTERASRTKSKEVKAQKRSVITSYMIRDFKQLIRFPALAFQSFAGIVIVPVITAVLPGMIARELGENIGLEPMISGIVMLYTMMLLCGINYYASAAFTRERETFYYNKILPITPKQILKAKLRLANVILAVGAGAVSISALLSGGVGVVSAVLMFVCNYVYGVAMNKLAIKRDLKRPKLNWTNVNEALKNDVYYIVPMLIGIVFGILVAAFGFLAGIIAPSATPAVWQCVQWVPSVILCVVVNLVIGRGYYFNCEERFERIEP